MEFKSLKTIMLVWLTCMAQVGVASQGGAASAVVPLSSGSGSSSTQIVLKDSGTAGIQPSGPQPVHGQSQGACTAEDHLQLVENIFEKQYAECLICCQTRPINQLQSLGCDKAKIMCRECVLRTTAPTCPYCKQGRHIVSMRPEALSEQQAKQLQQLRQTYPHIAAILERNQALQEPLQVQLQQTHQVGAGHMMNIPGMPMLPWGGNMPTHMSNCERRFIISLSLGAAGVIMLFFVLGPVLNVL